MKLLVFEYSCLCEDSTLIFEGYSMLKCLLNDLNEIYYFETYFLINKKFNNLNFENCRKIIIETEIETWLNKNISNYDYCLFIAPEDDLIQYHITKIVENHNVKILSSNSEASFICSSKYLTYKNTPPDILKIKTIKIDLDSYSIKKIESNFKNFNFIIKPDNKTSSDLIYHITNKKDFIKIEKLYKKNNIEYALLQEFIDGTPVSVSVLCNNELVNCISVNSQEIKIRKNKIEYLGCVTPIYHMRQKELFSLSEKIIKNIPGLNGFCGLDFIIIEDKIYFVEINSRLTTPFIVLQKNYEGNLTQQIIDLVVYGKTEKINFKKIGKFTKEASI